MEVYKWKIIKSNQEKCFAANKLTKEDFEIMIGIYYQRKKETDKRAKGYYTRRLNKTLKNKEKVNFEHLKSHLEYIKEMQ